MRFGTGSSLGTNFADAAHRTAGVPNDPRAAQSTLDAMFGGKRTGYDVTKGNMPSYLAGAQTRLTGASLEYDFAAREGSIGETEMERLQAMRDASTEAIKAKQTGGSIIATPDTGGGKIGADVRALMGARADMRLPGAGMTGESAGIQAIDDRVSGRGGGVGREAMGMGMVDNDRPMGPMGGFGNGMPRMPAGGGRMIAGAGF